MSGGISSDPHFGRLLENLLWMSARVRKAGFATFGQILPALHNHLDNARLASIVVVPPAASRICLGTPCRPDNLSRKSTPVRPLSVDWLAVHRDGSGKVIPEAPCRPAFLDVSTAGAELLLV